MYWFGCVRNETIVENLKADRSIDLQNSIENLYATFLRYRLPEGWNSVLYDPLFTREATLRSTPVRKLTSQDLSVYSWKAMTTWGSVEDFKHFLPRLLELMTPWEENGIGGFDPMMIGHKLSYAQWTKWPEREQSAVHDFYLALWSLEIMNTSLSRGRSLQLLSTIAHAEASLTEFIEQWESDMDDPVLSFNATMQLANSFGDHCSPGLDCFKVLNDLYERLEVQNEQVANWIYSDNMLQRMEDAYFCWADEPNAERFSHAHKWLDVLRQEREWKKSESESC